ncbi:MAG TPA: IS3 family transposase [Nitrospiraceae bacterium]|nr:IS3 family transposase [Nitrospiraceae bacterium]
MSHHGHPPTPPYPRGCCIDRLNLPQPSSPTSRDEICLHSGGEGAVSGGGVVPRHGRGAQRVLCLAPTLDEYARTRESRPGDADSGLLSGLAGPVWQSQDSSRPRAHGLQVGRHRVARLMRLHGLCSVSRRRAWKRPAMATPALVVANVLRRQFVATRPNQKWVSDITYVPTRQGWLYVAVLMDLYSRRIVGWAMDDQMTTTLTLKALEMALQQRPVQVGLLHHSDRGSQYGAMAYQQRLATRGIRC